MTNSKHIRDLYPEARTSKLEAHPSEAEIRPSAWWLVVPFFIAVGFWAALLFWIGPWLMEQFPLFVPLFLAAMVAVVAAGVFVKLALSVLAVLSGGR